MTWLDGFGRDLNHSLRLFRQSPAFTVAAVAALALGIGANTAIFSVVNTVLLRPVAYPDPDRIVLFLNTSPQGTGTAASPAKFEHYREQASVVQGGERAERAPDAHDLGGADPGRAARAEQPGSGIAAPVRRAAGFERAVDG